MKILFSPDVELINSTQTQDWGVDEIIIPSNFSNYTLPDVDDDLFLFVPTIINQDFAIEYDGVEFALRLYFLCLRRKKINIRIVLLGVETLQAFLLNFYYPNIMKCPGFDYILFNATEVKTYNKTLDEIDFDSSIDSINSLGIVLPKSYKSQHSFINEWSVYKWSEYMGFDNSSIIDALKNNLYFDYLCTLLKNSNEESVSNEILSDINNLEGRVLLIDDNQYWHIFFNDFFKNTDNSKFQFKPIGDEFKKLNADTIVEQCMKEIDAFEPDVILLDFRLNEDFDFSVKNFNNISGIKVLRELKGKKKLNPRKRDEFESYCRHFGSKVMMFTATGNLDYIFALQEFGADAFVFKERPENYIGKSSTKKIIDNFLSNLKKMLNCAIASKRVNGFLCNWFTYAYSSNPNLDDTLSTRLKHVVEVVRSLMQGNFLSLPKLKLIYLECFSILETFNTTEEDLYPFISNRFAPSLGLDPNKRRWWQELNNLRNSLAHGDDKVKISNQEMDVTVELIAENLILLCDFIDSLLKLYSNRIN